MRFRPIPRRRGLSSLEVVLTTGLVLPMAGFLYWTFEQSLDQFWFILGNLVGWPFL